MKKLIEFFLPEYKHLRTENEKLQKENYELYNDIHILVESKSKIQIINTRLKWKFYFKIEDLAKEWQ